VILARRDVSTPSDRRDNRGAEGGWICMASRPEQAAHGFSLFGCDRH
jgi:hypothetical protein